MGIDLNGFSLWEAFTDNVLIKAQRNSRNYLEQSVVLS